MEFNLYASEEFDMSGESNFCWWTTAKCASSVHHSNVCFEFSCLSASVTKGSKAVLSVEDLCR